MTSSPKPQSHPVPGNLDMNCSSVDAGSLQSHLQNVEQKPWAAAWAAGYALLHRQQSEVGSDLIINTLKTLIEQDPPHSALKLVTNWLTHFEVSWTDQPLYKEFAKALASRWDYLLDHEDDVSWNALGFFGIPQWCDEFIDQLKAALDHPSFQRKTIALLSLENCKGPERDSYIKKFSPTPNDISPATYVPLRLLLEEGDPVEFSRTLREYFSLSQVQACFEILPQLTHRLGMEENFQAKIYFCLFGENHDHTQTHKDSFEERLSLFRPPYPEALNERAKKMFPDEKAKEFFVSLNQDKVTEAFDLLNQVTRDALKELEEDATLGSLPKNLSTVLETIQTAPWFSHDHDGGIEKSALFFTATILAWATRGQHLKKTWDRLVETKVQKELEAFYATDFPLLSPKRLQVALDHLPSDFYEQDQLPFDIEESHFIEVFKDALEALRDPDANLKSTLEKYVEDEGFHHNVLLTVADVQGDSALEAIIDWASGIDPENLKLIDAATRVLSFLGTQRATQYLKEHKSVHIFEEVGGMMPADLLWKVLIIGDSDMMREALEQLTTTHHNLAREDQSEPDREAALMLLSTIVEIVDHPDSAEEVLEQALKLFRDFMEEAQKNMPQNPQLQAQLEHYARMYEHSAPPPNWTQEEEPDHEIQQLNEPEEAGSGKIITPDFYYPEKDTFYREEPKVGRNDPCICGSGKKFKKCCGK